MFGIQKKNYSVYLDNHIKRVSAILTYVRNRNSLTKVFPFTFA